MRKAAPLLRPCAHDAWLLPSPPQAMYMAAMYPAYYAQQMQQAQQMQNLQVGMGLVGASERWRVEQIAGCLIAAPPGACGDARCSLGPVA